MKLARGSAIREPCGWRSLWLAPGQSMRAMVSPSSGLSLGAEVLFFHFPLCCSAETSRASLSRSFSLQDGGTSGCLCEPVRGRWTVLFNEPENSLLFIKVLVWFPLQDSWLTLQAPCVSTELPTSETARGNGGAMNHLAFNLSIV